MSDGPRRLLPFALAEVLDRTPWPAAVIDRSALAAASRAAQGLPACFHWLVLEARLTGADPAVDLLASITDLGDGRARVADALARPLAGLEGARPLLTAWAAGAAPLDAIHVLWLEWDAPFERAPLQLHSIDGRFWGQSDAPAPGLAEQLALVDVGRGAALGDHSACLRRILAALPASGAALAAASLRPRGRDCERLFVGLPRSVALEWLRAIGWPGDREQASQWLQSMVAPWERAFLQIEYDERVGPYLGIEPQQTGGSRAELRERRRFIDELVRDGRTAAERAAATLRWHAELPREDGARELRSLHMKCVLGPSREPLVKVYLGVHFEA